MLSTIDKQTMFLYESKNNKIKTIPFQTNQFVANN